MKTIKQLLTTIAVLLCSVMAHAYDFEVDGIYYNIISEKKLTVEVTRYPGVFDEYNGTIEIPATVMYHQQEYNVTSIRYSAFSSCTYLTSISIPNSVTSIGESAFYGCSSLSSVHISDIVAWCNIDFYNSESNPLYYARNLYLNGEKVTNIVIPEGVTSIDNYTFYNRSCLTSITIEATIPPTLNGEFDFGGIIYIPDNTLSAYKKAWGDEYNFVCNENSLTIHIETPGTLSDKIYEAWQRPANVAKLTLTGTLNDDDFTLMRETMTSLTEVDLSGIINTSGVNFKEKDNLVTICLPKNLSEIENNAFYRCSSIKNITIGNHVTSIGYEAFDDCSSLISIHISDIAAWCNIDFYGQSSNPLLYGGNLYLNGEEVTNLVIPEGVTSIRNYTFYHCSSLSSITIPNSVTSIGESAFCGCSSLTSVTIGNSVTSIGDYAFQNCSSLTSVHISDIVAWCNIDFKGYASTPLYYAENLYLNGEKITNLVIPEGITSIRNCTFYRCLSLSSITIPNSVTSIGESAFYYCEALTSITIPNSVTSIGEVAFGRCSSLDTITCLNFNPPATNRLGVYQNECTLIIPKEAYANYVKHTYWGQFLTIKPLDSNIYKKIDISINDSSFGNINIANGYYCINDSITITATPNKGYHFTQWSDGNTENPRTIVITQDTTFTAEFAQNPTYNVTLSADNGTVSGVGTYSEGDTITITATANKGYKFKEWSDGNTDNPRIIVVTEDIKLTAIFEEIINTPIENAFDNQIGIYYISGTLHIKGLESDYQIYTTTGQIIYSGKQTILTLPHGIYLIVINGKTHKIAL